MTNIDLSPLLAPVLGVIGTVLASVALMLVKRGLDLLQTRTAIKFTDGQRAEIYAATQTATGMVTAEMTKGAMSVADLHTSNKTVIAAGNYILAAAPEAANALGITQAKAVQMVVGKVGNVLAEDATVPTVAGTQVAPSTQVNSAPVLVVNDQPAAPAPIPVGVKGMPFLAPADGNGARG